MLFNSIQFLIFFPVVTTIYYLIPKKVQYIWLLISSYFFYMGWNYKYALLLFITTVITYFGGGAIEYVVNHVENDKARDKYKKIILALGIVLNLGILGYYKYFSFTINMINHVVETLHLGKSFQALDIILPVGISFYIFQALGYLMDVYRRKIHAERNFLRYALFVSFFPQLVAGPIERSENLLMQLAKPVAFSYESFRKGLLLMLWGFFLKLVIADRAAIIVNVVYGNENIYNGFYIIVATFLFSMQIYCDFYGYSIIARGTALVLGISLMDNFQAPYFSKSVKEFWRRWHISLSGWFRDYLYIPLGGNRLGMLRKELNLLIVFSLSGLWHGAAFSYIVWGLLNGIYQVLGECIFKIKGWISKKIIAGEMTEAEAALKLRQKKTFSRNLRKRAVTFLLVSFAWLFFRAEGLVAAIGLIKNMFVFNWMILFDGSLFELGVEKHFFIVMLLAIVVLFFVDYQKYRGKDVTEILLNQEWWFRVIVEGSLLFSILLFGCYGELYDTSEFIYFQF